VVAVAMATVVLAVAFRHPEIDTMVLCSRNNLIAKIEAHDMC
jgi:hypothetical protein